MKNLQSLTAVVVLATGVVMSFVDYFTPPQGEIAASVLDYLKYTMMYAGSILGVKTYVDFRMPKQ